MSPSWHPVTHCKDCGIELNNDNRSFGTKGKERPRNRCMNCYNKYMREYAKTNEDKVHQAKRKGQLKDKYELTEEGYNELFNSQGGVCAICKFPCISGDRLCIDHNHTTGEVRGLLCRSCNLAIAAVGEDENLIYSLLDYIRKYNDCPMPGIRPTQDLEK